MKHHILIVEDNQPSRELLSDWLELEGFSVVAVENLERAFGAFQDQPPDAVLLDVQVGLEDGLSLAKWVREKPQFRNTPVIAVTARAAMRVYQNPSIFGHCGNSFRFVFLRLSLAKIQSDPMHRVFLNLAFDAFERKALIN
jgi:CheY-like chemotaxis protein